MPPKKDAEQVPAVSEEERRYQNLVASTFANIELESTKQTLDKIMTLYNQVREENARLQQELIDANEDSRQVMQVVRDQSNEKEEKLKAEAKERAQQMEALRKRFVEEKKGLEEVITSKNTEIQDLTLLLDSKQADLDALQAFEREKKSLYAQMAADREDHRKLVEELKAEISRQKFLSLEEKVHLKAEERDMTEKFEREVEDRAKKMLNQKTKEIQQENFHLLEEKNNLEHELFRVAELQQQTKRVALERKRDLELVNAADAEHVKRAVQKTREVKDLQAKIEKMEQNITATVAEFEQQMKKTAAEASTKVMAAMKQRDEAIRTAELIQRDFIKMRQLTKTIVRQRSDLELFFNEALEYVREQIKRERDQKPKPPLALTIESQPKNSQEALVERLAKPKGASGRSSNSMTHSFFEGGGNFDSIYRGGQSAGGQSAGLLPPIGLGSRESGNRPAASASGSMHDDPVTEKVGKVDISELSWSDKERILRILFAKINASNAAKPVSDREKIEGKSAAGAELKSTLFITGGAEAGSM